MNDVIFEPLQFRNLTVKNRLFRSSISGRFDNYDGSGTQARINWEEKFARGGIGAIITSFVPVSIRGRILPNYATIDVDERIPFWRAVVDRVHSHECKFIIQLSHSGRQRDNSGVENVYNKALSSTNEYEPLHGFPCQAMTWDDIKETVQQYAEGARRAKEAGADGVETHSANGYLITQFLSSGINTLPAPYGGPLKNRARFLMEIIRAIREKVGNDFHFQAKISAVDRNNAVLFWEKPGNMLEESVLVSRWAENPAEWAKAAGEDPAAWEKIRGVDAIHVSTGSSFPHPLNPPGDFPADVLARTYETVISSGVNTMRNFILFRHPLGRALFRALWLRIQKNVRGVQLKVPQINGPLKTRNLSVEAMQALLDQYQGVSLTDARAIKSKLKIPVICTGGFQQAAYIAKAISENYCDAVSMARPLIANNDLPLILKSGADFPNNPCTYCNRCLVHDIEDPLGCYNEDRYGSYNELLESVMEVFKTAAPLT
jgi:2,4-dienoyl-CoA reductase-like NADH-dependent reductase (Old Yellow Enzyme family)